MAEHPFTRGGADDGKLGVSIDRFYGEDYVCVELMPGVTFANLTAQQARAVAHDLTVHADALKNQEAS
jgi:hypothetical protein